MNRTQRSVRTASLLLLLVLFTVFLASAAPQSGKYLVYVGTYTNDEGSKSKGIYAYRYDAATAQLTSLGLAAETTNPSFVAVHPNGKFLYAVNELGNYKGPNSGGVSAFAIDHTTGKLTFLNELPSRGADPCYITVDRTGKYVLVANYTGGSVAVFPVHKDGRLGEPSEVVQHQGHGTDPKRQEGPHAHSIDLSPDNRFAFVDDLGLDELLIHRFDATRGDLTTDNPPFVFDPGTGPRHFALHPNGNFAYVIGEMQGTVTVLQRVQKVVFFEKVQTVSTLPAGNKGEKEDAEIAVHRSGKFLYASNRGDGNSIAVFAIDDSRGTLTLVEYASTQGKTPRSFEIDPTGTLLFAANQKSDTIVIFKIDQTTGKLTPTGQVLDVPTPVCVKFVALN
ncbi:MAG TPA: lactonase family protein [Candidatus Sulfotelmatobacter sp.]|nr:lactonase family protein [Candidatus Sulfotelmatobacter sp.]